MDDAHAKATAELEPPILFASPLWLWRIKKPLKREKDYQDMQFLHRLLTAQGISPPE